jgi:hypothetical protein
VQENKLEMRSYTEISHLGFWKLISFHFAQFWRGDTNNTTTSTIS